MRFLSAMMPARYRPITLSREVCRCSSQISWASSGISSAKICLSVSSNVWKFDIEYSDRSVRVHFSSLIISPIRLASVSGMVSGVVSGMVSGFVSGMVLLQ